MRVNRQGLMIWFQHMKNIKHIKRFGHLLYVSKRQKYAVIYVNQDTIEQVEAKLLQFPFITEVQYSYKPFLRTNFENVKPDEAKQNN
ncbi:YlbG family protein [Barrientosiimonas marina]|uniref:UPF0298 protein ACFQU8_00405 n=1 Tax=Lentibacillus kimchii TaxID=1542911 RepID=A0ABW2UP67_9BACI